jgi:hypothetical protein
MNAPFPGLSPNQSSALALPKDLQRPRLLMRAARIGLQDYRRDRDLRRILPLTQFSALKSASAEVALVMMAQQGAALLEWLTEEEAKLESARRAATAGYSPLRHIEVMIALLAELRLTRGM